MKRTLHLLISLLIVVCFCVCLVSCTYNKEDVDIWENAIYTQDSVLGEGDKIIKVKVVALEKSVTFTINTHCNTLGEALVKNKLVSGDIGPYGLYIKYVNGIYADYEKNHFYWAINKSGQALMTSVDYEQITGGEEYEFIFTE